MSRSSPAESPSSDDGRAGGDGPAGDDRPAGDETRPDSDTRAGNDEDPRLASQEQSGGSTHVRCDRCGAAMRWDPEPDALACEHCGHTREVPRSADVIHERPLSSAGAAARGLGLELRVSECDGCGARISFEESRTATACLYCGSSSVLEHAANRNALRPESVIPLDVTRATVEKAFKDWLGKLWFRPNALRAARSQNVVGVYVPYWTFDVAVHSEWSADAGYYYYVTVPHTTYVNGKPVITMRQERRTRWEPAWGSRDDAYDDVLVPASGGLANSLLGELGIFDMTALVPYRPEYLAGWHAEEYRLDLEGGWRDARKRIVKSQRERCSGAVPGDTQRGLSVDNDFSEPHWKHVLLPVWSLGYRHGGKHYQVLVHGQSGRVVGEAPWSWLKITLAVLLGVAGLGTGLALAP